MANMHKSESRFYAIQIILVDIGRKFGIMYVR